MSREIAVMDGNEAVAHVAHKTNEVIAIYPITPSSPMGEWSDIYSSRGERNIWGAIPTVTEMQSEGGASAAVHGALQAGALTTTFTSSQGLLLMIPTMYKIAGELTSTVFHVAARSVAAQALSIFGEHSDVYATRQTGFAMLASNGVQEAMDMALIAQAATLESRIPFVHFFDGFRTSHEETKVEVLSLEDMKAMIDDDLVSAHHLRGMTPDRPILRGTSQNPDVFFQGRETVNRYYEETPEITQKAMDKFASITSRKYKIYEYYGAEDATKLIVIMGSACDAVEESVNYLNANGQKVGVLKVRLFRPFSSKHLLSAIPSSVKKIAVMDRTKEPGAEADPLYLDVVSAFYNRDNRANIASMPIIVAGRYGLSSKEFTPAMIKSIYDELEKEQPKHKFTIGIYDDITNSSLDYDSDFDIESEETIRAMFYGLGSDGTVGANKNSIKIIGTETDNYAQGYFVYDSKKSGSMTVSHLRFGKKAIKAPYLITNANFIGVHQFVFLESFDVVKNLVDGGTLLLNSPYSKEETWNHLPKIAQEHIMNKKLKVYVIDGYKVAKEAGMGARINTIMQTCFFYISGVLPQDEAIAKIKESIKKTYGKKGGKIVEMNFNAVDKTLENLYEMKAGDSVTSKQNLKPAVSSNAPDFVKDVIATIIEGRGDEIPVSKIPADGTWPTATTQFEKRNIGLEVPIWDPKTCIQCNKCVNVCPHACIRAKVYSPELLDSAPKAFKSIAAKGKEFKGLNYTIQVAVEDCTGCELCTEVCPAKNKEDASKKAINMAPQIPLRETERENWNYFLNDIPDFDRASLKISNVKNSQLLRPLFEFSGACAGCGETPYVKLTSQLFGDRMIIANATGCSSIYGGNLPTTPWAVDKNGRGPTWSNSLFEDCAEFGLGFRLAVDKHKEEAKELFESLQNELDRGLISAIIDASDKQRDESEIFAQRDRVEKLKEIIEGKNLPNKKRIKYLADYLVRKSVWSFGGDGWAYDIGFGGLDHVVASGKDINLLVMDTEVYSNTGGQTSKATPEGAIAKFSAAGKPIYKKDLGEMLMSYGYVYVAQVAMGSNDAQTLKAFIEAENYDGPSVIIAYSHCIAHGIPMKKGMSHQDMAVKSGHWPLYRYNPELAKEGKNPLIIDSKDPSLDIEEYMYSETRYAMLKKMNPELAKKYIEGKKEHIQTKWKKLKYLAAMS